MDFIELHESERHARQLAEMGAIPHRIEVELAGSVRALTPHSVAVSWSISWLPDMKAIRAREELVKAAILTAVPTLGPGDEVELQPRPAWVVELTASCWASATPAFGFISSHAEQTSWVGQAAESMADFLLDSRKGKQLAAFADARVVAIDRVSMPIPGELAVALKAREARIPANWQAIYWVIPGAELASHVKVWARA